MKLFRSIRQNKAMNLVMRRILLVLIQASDSIWLKKKAAARWRINGTVRLDMGSGTKIKLYSKIDDIIVDQLYFRVYNETSQLGFFTRLAEKAELIADIGANTGLYSIVARTINLSAKIHAFEPYAANANRFELNCRLNNIFDISLHRIGIGQESSVLNFYIPANGERVSQVSSFNKDFSSSHHQNDVSEYEPMKIKIKSLDSYFANYGKIKSALFKIDVETFEKEVLLGAVKSIMKHRPIIFIEIQNTKENITFFEKFLLHNKYSILTVNDNRVAKLNGLDFSSGNNFVLTPQEKMDLAVSNYGRSL